MDAVLIGGRADPRGVVLSSDTGHDLGGGNIVGIAGMSDLTPRRPPMSLVFCCQMGDERGTGRLAIRKVADEV